MNKIQASLFLLLQESIWTDFQIPQDDQEIQEFISARFLEIHKRLSKNLSTESNNIDTREVRRLNQENLSRFSEKNSLENLESSRSVTESSITNRAEILSTENTDNEINRNFEKDIFYVNKDSDDVKPMFMIGDFSSEKERQETFPEHTFRILPQGLEKIIESIKLGRLQEIECPPCPYEGNGCPEVNACCPALAAISVEELQSILRAVIEAQDGGR